MSEPDYAPEFIEALQAWEQSPPLTAEFVFDLPPSDKRKADKVGVLMYQSVLLKQDHPDLDFSRIRAITFTMDVHRTGDELENIVGHDLPQYRNAAARMDAFHINLGPGQILIITDELANASLSPQIATRLAAWELIRTELARTIAIYRLLDAPSPLSTAPRWISLARYAWTEYFCGLTASVEGLQTPMARQRLRQSLEEDPLAISEAIKSFVYNQDVDERTTRSEGAVKGLFEAMAEVHGQLETTQTTLSAIDPQLDTLIRAQGVAMIWDGLGEILQKLGAHPAQWDNEQTGLNQIVALGLQYLASMGISSDE
jgi:hypothetical protein